MTKEGSQELKENSDTAKENREDFSESVMKLVEILDQDDWRTEYEHSEDSVKRSQKFLAEQYFEISKTVITSLISLSFTLVLTDILFPISAFLYGLTVSIWGSTLLAVPSLKGRYQISAIVDNDNKSAIRRVEAKRMTYTNAGLGFLILGFFIQLVTHQVNANNIMSGDILATYFPDWVAILALIAIFLIVVRTINLLAESIYG